MDVVSGIGVWLGLEACAFDDDRNGTTGAPSPIFVWGPTPDPDGVLVLSMAFVAGGF